MKARYLFPKDYMADPSANVFNGRLYVYPSHDWDSGESFDDDGGHFQMKDYHVLSMDDVMEGEVTDHGVILDVKDVPWAEKQMWDNDVVEKEGEFHLAFSVPDMDAAHAKHAAMGCICFENPGMGIYFIEDPDGYWLEVIPPK